MDRRKFHEEAKLTRQRRKRRHDESEPVADSSLTDNDLVNCNSDEAEVSVVAGEVSFNFGQLASELINDARADDLEDFSVVSQTELEEFRPIPLHRLFQFPATTQILDGDKEWYNFYWKGGIDTLDRELTVLEDAFGAKLESL